MSNNAFTPIHVCSRRNSTSTHEYSRLFTRPFRGVNGVNGALVIDTSWPDGHKNHRTIISNYDPVNEIWEVGQDWDLENKPWE